MGRIKTTLIKRVTKELIEKHGSEFSGDFDENKVALGKLANIPSRKIRNSVAGYAVRLKKQAH